MIVLIGGMQRSGSTFTFNIAREILAGTGKISVYPYGVLRDALAVSHGHCHLVMKAHIPEALVTNLIQKQAIVCICTYRKPEDAIASWLKAFGGELQEVVLAVKDWLDWHETVGSYALNINYDRIESDPLSCIFDIQQYLTGKTDEVAAVRLRDVYSKENVKRKCDALEKGHSSVDVGFSYYDKTTFFHKRHVSSLEPTQAASVLSACQIQDVRSALGGQIGEDGDYRPGFGAQACSLGSSSAVEAEEHPTPGQAGEGDGSVPLRQQQEALLETLAAMGRCVEARAILETHFDEGQYLAVNPDVCNAVLQGRVGSGLLHWIHYGCKEKRSVSFVKRYLPR